MANISFLYFIYNFQHTTLEFLLYFPSQNFSISKYISNYAHQGIYFVISDQIIQNIKEKKVKNILLQMNHNLKQLYTISERFFQENQQVGYFVDI